MAAAAVMFIVGALLAVGLVMWSLWARARREKVLRAWAAEHDWTYEPLDRHMASSYQGLRPFGQGSARRCRHIVTGRYEGHEFVLFQYQYTVQSGKSSHTYFFRVIDVQAPLAGHGLSIQKEHIGHKIADALGREDIDFESDEFSKRFWVQCDDRRFAYDVITPAMMEFLLPHDDWTLQWRGNRLLLHQSGTLEPQRAQEQLRLVAGFLERLPRHLLATD